MRTLARTTTITTTRTRRTTRTRTLEAMASLGIVVLALSGCGGDDDDASSVEDAIKEAIEEGNLDEAQDQLESVGGDESELPDACELVTTEDATGLFGVDAVEQEDTSPVDLGASCIYGSAGGDELGTVTHLLQVRVFDGEQFFDAEAEGAQDVDGLGDQATVRTGDAALAGVDVQFVRDGKTVSLSYSTVNIGVEHSEQVNAADHEDEVVALARQVSDRL